MAEKILPKINTDVVRNIFLLSGLLEAEKDALLRESDIHFYRRNEHLFRYGDPIRHFHIICSGTVRLYYETRQGDDVTTDIRTAGDTVCTTCIFAPFENHGIHAGVVHDATVVEFPMQWLIDAARRHGVVAANLLSAISQRTSNIKADALNRMMMPPLQRVACFLKKMCVSYGFNPDGFVLPYSKSLIASRLGLRLETLSRTLPKLEELGIMADGKHVALRDLKTLEQKLCSHCLSAESCHARKVLMPHNNS